MKIIKVFLASSNALEKEKEAIEVSIARLNDDLVEKGAYIKVVMWDKLSKTYHGKRKQDQINKHIEESDIFIVLFPSYGEYTYEEYQEALKLHKKADNNLQVLVYLDKNKDEDFEDIKDEINKIGQVWSDYESIDSLTSSIKDELKFYLKSHYSLDLLEKSKETTYYTSGFARDLNIDILSSPKNKFHKELFNYEFNHCEIKVCSDLVSFKSDITSIYNDSKKEEKGIIEGEGKLSDGYAYLIYKGSYPDANEYWHGTMILRLESMGVISGYWISKHSLDDNGGPFAIGEIELKRKTIK
jgi:hypothetical protein